jgi:hypothetical protein
MAKIKIFEGAGPNPNVGFTNLTPSRYAGETGDAIAKVANNFTQQAIKYAEIQKKQTDVSQEIQATGEKQKFLASARANALQPDGTYDTDGLEKALTDFDGRLKEGMSKDAYQSYSLKESQKNAHIVATAQNENLKITRKNNLNTFSEGVVSLVGQATLGSFEDMMIAKNEAIEYSTKGIGSGIITQPEADKLLKQTFSKAAKSVLDDLTTLSDKGLSQVESAFTKAELFVQADPYGAFSSDPFLKAEAISDLRAKRLTATSQALAKEQAQEFRAEKFKKLQQKATYSDMNSKYSKALAENDFESIQKIQNEILELRDNEGLDEYHVDRLSKLPQKRIAQDDNMYLGQILENPDRASDVIDLIQTPSTRAQAEKFLSVVPQEFVNTYKANVKLTGGNKVEVAQSLQKDAESLGMLKVEGDTYTKQDLEALYKFYPFMLDPTNPSKKIVLPTSSSNSFIEMNNYVNSLNKQGAMLDVSSVAARLGKLRQALDIKNKELEDERRRKETVPGN